MFSSFFNFAREKSFSSFPLSRKNMTLFLSEYLTFFRGLVTGITLGIALSVSLLILGIYWLLDKEKRITPVSQGQRDLPLEASDPSLYDPPPIQPELWPKDIVEFLKNSLEPDLEVDHVVQLKKSLPIVSTASNTNTTTNTGTNNTGTTALEEVYMTPTMDVGWVNILVSRLFLSLRGSRLYKMRTCEKMSNKMNAKLKNNTFMVCCIFCRKIVDFV